MKKITDIAIVGIGAHYPGALDIKTLWENIIARREQFRRFPDERLPIDVYSDLTQKDKDKTYVTQGAFIDGFSFDWLKYRVPKKTVESADIVHWLTYEVAQLAIADAGYTKESISKDKTGVILGNTLTGEETRTTFMRQRWPYVERVMKSSAKDLNLTEEQTKLFIERSKEYYKSVFPEMTEDSLAGGLSNTIAGRVCNTMDLHGGGYTVDGACSSSLIAVSTAAEKLISGTLDMAIAGGVDVSLDTFEMVGFARTGALTPDKMRVYDKRGNGFMPGEGCGLIVMKRLEDARRDGDKVYATIKGWGMSSDGKGSLTAPSGVYQGLALKRAYDMAGYAASTLDFVEGHGTGTTVGDREELKGVAMNVGTDTKEGLRSCGMTSFKSISGHTKAASGIAGLIKATMALNQRVIPPTAGCEQPNISFDSEEGKSLYPILLGEACDTSRTLRAGVSAMGFGGINTHVTLESADAPFESIKPQLSNEAMLVSSQKSEIFPLIATDVASLLTQVKKLKNDAFGMSIAELPDLAVECSRQLSKGNVRATLIVGHPDELQASLDKLISYLQSNELAKGDMIEVEKNTIFLSDSLEKNKLGFVYPGQGSQQLNMARNLVQRFDWAKEMLKQADKLLCEEGWEEGSLAKYIFKATDRAVDNSQNEKWLEALTQTDVAQPAICFASSLWTERLKRIGITPDVVGGHSLGELSAFSAAGAFEYKELISLAQLRGEAMNSTPSKGAMAALLTSADMVQKLLERVDGYLTIANINSPKQIVVSGESHAIDALVTLSLAEDIRAKKLNVSNAFHSKLVEEASLALHKKAAISNELNTTCKIISSVTAKNADAEMDMVKYFGDQVLAQVDFVGLVEEMKKSCDIFVEVGTGSVLSNMISYIDTSLDVFPLESESMNDVSFNKFVAHYFVSGGTLDWEALYDSRLIRPFTPSSQKQFFQNACEKPFEVETISAEKSNLFSTSGSVASNNVSLPSVIETLQRIHDSKIIDAVNLLQGVSSAPVSDTIKPAVNVTKESEEKSEQVSLDTPKEVEKNNDKVEKVLFSMIAEMTGFPEESLELDFKLLDDLNLDSIKATELIVDVTKALGLEIELDPAPLANATLQEIIDLFNSYMDTESVDESQKSKEVLYAKIAEMTGFPEESLELDFKLLDDLNLDSIKATELIVDVTKELGLEIELDPAPLANATLQEIIDVLDSHDPLKVNNKPTTPKTMNPDEKPWVRNFIMKPIIEDIEKNSDPLHSEDRVFIFCEDGEKDLALNLKSKLAQTANITAVNIHTFKEVQADTSLFNEEINDLVFLVLPRNKQVEDSHSAIDNMVRRLALVSGVKSKTTICFAQFAGGTFANADTSLDIEQSSTLAWASSLHLEQKDLKIRVIDFDKNVSETMFTDKVIAEVSSASKFVACGYTKEGDRQVMRPEVHESTFDTDSSIKWSSSDTILVTGGAKGITAECALAFAKATGVKMALLGSSSVPKVEDDCEINTTLKRFHTLGLEAQYYACDLLDEVSVSSTIDKIKDDLGEVTGVIHGAARNSPKPLSYVSVDAAKEEVAPKVNGAINLLSHFEDKSLKMFLSLTSIIGVSGMIGNGWYGFSNEVLDLLVAQYGQRHKETKLVSIAYSVWGETGMGAKMGSTDYLAKMGIMAIPTQDGVERFLELILKDAPTRQVVVTAKLEGLDTWSTKELHKPHSNRYLENIIYAYPEVNVISQVHLHPNTDSYLNDHVWKGSLLFPTVFGLEAMSQVVAYMMGIDHFENLKIENINLERPIVVHPSDGISIQINALALERVKGEHKKIKVFISTEKSHFKTEHFSATFILDGAENFTKNTEGLAEFSKKRLDIDVKKDLYSWLLFQGPKFQRLTDFYQIDNDTAIYDASTQDGEEKEWMLGSPYVRDALLQSVQPMVPHHTCLPIFIDSISIANTAQILPQKIRACSLNKGLINEVYNTTVYAMTDASTVCEKLEGYRLKILEHRTEFPEKFFFAQAEQYAEEHLVQKLQNLAENCKKEKPILHLTYIPTLYTMNQKERHETIKPLAESWFKTLGLSLNLSWDDTNKPMLDDEMYTFSISHSKSYLFFQLSKSDAGCDIEQIVQRSEEKWESLLHLSDKNFKSIRDMFISKGDSINTAGTRLWSIRESIYKSIGTFNGNIEIATMENDCAIVKANDGDMSIEILSYPIVGERGATNMVAFIV